jgi:hypothetical protein
MYSDESDSRSHGHGHGSLDEIQESGDEGNDVDLVTYIVY